MATKRQRVDAVLAADGTSSDYNVLDVQNLQRKSNAALTARYSLVVFVEGTANRTDVLTFFLNVARDGVVAVRTAAAGDYTIEARVIRDGALVSESRTFSAAGESVAQIRDSLSGLLAAVPEIDVVKVTVPNPGGDPLPGLQILGKAPGDLYDLVVTPPPGGSMTYDEDARWEGTDDPTIPTTTLTAKLDAALTARFDDTIPVGAGDNPPGNLVGWTFVVPPDDVRGFGVVDLHMYDAGEVTPYRRTVFLDGSGNLVARKAPSVPPRPPDTRTEV